MRQTKSLVTGGGGLCGVRYVALWHAVIKSSLGLTAWHLFTEDFNFPDSPFPLPITPSPPLALWLGFRLYFSPSVTSVSPCSLAFSVTPLSLRVLTQFVPATTSYQGLLSSESSLFSPAQIHLFYHHSNLSIYTGLRGRNCWSIWAMLCVIFWT